MIPRPPYLSVIVPTHNVDTWVVECLDSILSQNFDELEVIVVDDHSVDQTVALVQGIAARDSRVILVSADGLGGANARNLGVTAAGGDYLVFADGDDIVPQGAYRAMVTSLEHSGSDMAIGDFLKFSPIRTWRPSTSWPSYRTEAEGLALPEAPSLIRGRACWNKMFRRSFWTTEGISFPEVARSNDIVPMVAALTRARGIDVVHDVVYLYRERTDASSMTARAGTSGSVLSYFGQEVECGRLLLALENGPLLAQYGSLIMQADGWVHLDRFLASVDEADPATVAELCSSIAELSAMMPVGSFNRANLMPQVIFALISAQRFDLALQVHRGIPAIEARPVVDTAIFDWWTTIARVASSVLTDEHTLTSQILEKLMLQPLLAVAQELPGRNLPGLLNQIAEFSSSFPRAARPGNPDARAVLDCALEGDADRLAELSVLSSTLIQLTRPRSVAGFLYFEGRSANLPVGSSAVLSASRRQSPDTVILATLKAPRRGSREVSLPWSRFVPRSGLREPGTWDVRVDLTAPDGTRFTRPLRVDQPLATFPANRFARVVTVESRRANAPVIIETRQPLLRRLAPIVAKRMPNLARVFRRVRRLLAR